ncbi:MAG: class I SAM-dependent methyltransferase [Rickettsiales bacterium]|jgi:SAM-dependent methyltransferase|nr:class I SAM-dependent methyltransferase [Rickettsiales bacterium]
MKFIHSREEFNASNSAGWNRNYGFWSDEIHRDENSLPSQKITMAVIRDFASAVQNPTVVDFGCGHAWIYEALANTPKLKFNYMGLDYTEGFINANQQKYAGKKNARFIKCDITGADLLSHEFKDKADILVNHFNLIETWDIDSVFANMSNMLKLDGLCVVTTADATSKIASLSRTRETYNSNIRKLASVKNPPAGQPKQKTLGFAEEIINGAQKTGKYFHNAAHTFADYVNYAIWAGMFLHHVDEIFRTDMPNPQIEYVMQFKKLKVI